MITLSQSHVISCSYLGSKFSSVINLANFDVLQAIMAAVDVVPLFLETSPDLQVDDEDLLILSPTSCGAEGGHTGIAVCIQHIPTGLIVESSGKRTFQRAYITISM